jgi:hypothetical protein
MIYISMTKTCEILDNVRQVQKSDTPVHFIGRLEWIIALFSFHIAKSYMQ